MAERYENRRYKVIFKLPHDDAVLMDRRVEDILNGMGSNNNDTDCYNSIWIAGIEAKEKELLERTGKPTRASVQAAKLKEFREVENEKKVIGKIYETLGLEKFVTWCTENNLDAEEFLKEYDMQRAASTTVTDRYLAFLDRNMRTGETIKTDDVHKLAIEQEVITTDAEWNLMRVVAYRYGYNYKYGTWKQP